MIVPEQPWVMGVSASHNGAVCLLHGDEIVVAIQEERLTRRKRARIEAGKRCLAIDYCLQAAGITVDELDLVVASVHGVEDSAAQDIDLNPSLQPARRGIRTLTIPHHRAHAIGAFATSGFEDATVLVVDGVGSRSEALPHDELATLLDPGSSTGSRESTSIYGCRGHAIVPLEKNMVPDGAWYRMGADGFPAFATLGGMFSAVAQQLFGNPMEAGKVMGLAPYGRPRFADGLWSCHDGRVELRGSLPEATRLQGQWPAHQDAYQDLAASVQAALEEALLHLVARARSLGSSRNLCYAGGVALNCIANERIIREGGFDSVYVMPAAEDSGVALGAAFHGLWSLTGRNTRVRVDVDAMGCRYSEASVEAALASVPGIRWRRPARLEAHVAEALDEGEIVGFFRGRSELGPRALGQRSILCDPRRPDGKDVLNSRVKFREAFRPFAPVILHEHAREWFELGNTTPDSPFMMRIVDIREDKRARVPAVVHVDGTGRLQTVTERDNPPLHRLLRAFFERTGVPMLLNTSFNIMGEPIVETPEDALWSLLCTGIDMCVLENDIVRRQPGFGGLMSLVPQLAAHAYTLRGVPEDGRIDAFAPRLEGLSFTVDSPWGRHEHVLDADAVSLLPVLAEVDGRRTGTEIFERLITEGTMSPDMRDVFVRSLMLLRRLSIVRLVAAP
jgi:carbamoyltransferase